MQNIEKDKILKKIKDNFKKKRGRWKIEVESFDSFSASYDKASELLSWLSTCFNEDEKEKYSFNKIVVGITPTNSNYELVITYQR